MNKSNFYYLSVALLMTLAALALSATQVWACGGGVICVDADAPGPIHDGLSWTTAYTNVQAALDWTNVNTTTTHEIWVAEGVYYPDESSGHVNDAVTETFCIAWNNVSLYGGFAATETLRTQRDWAAHATVLSGDIDGNDWNTDTNSIAETWNDLQGNNAWHVLYLDGETNQPILAATVLDGFIITAGYANGDDNYWDNEGGGLYCAGDGIGHACSPTLNNITFSGNRAVDGGGMLNYGCGGGISSPRLTNVTFNGNMTDNAGGGMANYGCLGGASSPILTNVTFSNNRAAEVGGGMINIGLSSTSTSSPVLTNVVFSGNWAGNRGGGMVNDGVGGGESSPSLTNVIFSGNQAGGNGGGMYNDGSDGVVSSPTLTNVTFSGNQAGNHGGGIYNDGFFSGGESKPVLINCILWGNLAGTAGSQIYDHDAMPTITYSDVQWSSGVYTGKGNLNVDPQFVAPITATAAPTTTGDYRLQVTSPVIDAGDNLSVTVDADLDGNPRRADVPTVADAGSGPAPIVDMGAYEAHGNTAPTLSIPDILLEINKNKTLDLWTYAGDNEDANDELTFTVINVSTASLAIVPGGGHGLTITPAVDWMGIATVEVQATDSGGLSVGDTFEVNVAILKYLYLPTILRTG